MFLLRMRKDSENLHNKDILNLGLQGQAGSCINKRAEGHQSKVYSEQRTKRDKGKVEDYKPRRKSAS